MADPKTQEELTEAMVRYRMGHQNLTKGAEELKDLLGLDPAVAKAFLRETKNHKVKDIRGYKLKAGPLAKGQTKREPR